MTYLDFEKNVRLGYVISFLPSKLSYLIQALFTDDVLLLAHVDGHGGGPKADWTLQVLFLSLYVLS